MNEKDMMDIAAGATGLAALFDWLPAVAALITVLWGLIRLYEWYRVRILGKEQDFKL